MDETGAGRAVLIVGASSEIGQAVARRFHSQGDRVVGVSRENPKQDLEHMTHYVADCSNPAEVAQIVARAVSDLGGRLDVVIPAAAAAPRARAVDTDDQAWHTAISSTLESTFYVCRESLPFMGKGGSIVAISSIVASIASPGISGYAAAKGGINALVRVLALECGSTGIRVNAVAPGLIGGSNLPEASAGYPLRRTGTPEDVAAAVAFLASPDAAFITGVILPVDGGLSAGQPAVYLRPDLMNLMD